MESLAGPVGWIGGIAVVAFAAGRKLFLSVLPAIDAIGTVVHCQRFQDQITTSRTAILLSLEASNSEGRPRSVENHMARTAARSSAVNGRANHPNSRAFLQKHGGRPRSPSHPGKPRIARPLPWQSLRTRLRRAATFCSQATHGSGFSVACSSSRPLNLAPCKTHQSPPVRLEWLDLRVCAGPGGCAARPRGRAPA